MLQGLNERFGPSSVRSLGSRLAMVLGVWGLGGVEYRQQTLKRHWS